MVKSVAAAPSVEDSLEKSQNRVKAWITEINQALKREDGFRKEGKKLVKMYEGAMVDQIPYNILYSNTETIAPAVYSSTPRPNVRPRFKSGDQTLAMAASKVCQNLLNYFIDCGDASYSTFDDLMNSSVLEGLVPGRGTVRFKYDAEIEGQEPGEGDQEELAESSEEQAQEPQERVVYETVCGEPIPWDRVLFGFAKKWKDVPWMAIAWPMTREELVDNFGEIGQKVKLSSENTTEGASNKEESEDKEDSNSQKIAWVYEIWAKRDRKVIFVTEGYPDGPLRESNDPFDLEGFFPIPQPLTFVTKIKSLVPVALYKLYEQQAEELNTITRRIRANTAALRQRGFYDATIQGIDKVLQAVDNEFIPADNVAALQQGQGLQNSIWMVPIQELVGVLQQLYSQRESCKSVIFEITGIADIMRGSSQASETLGAQELKTQWGGLRLKKLQKAVANYTVESLRIMAEIALKKLSQETIIQMTGLEFPTQAQKAQIQGIMQQAQSTGQQIPPEQIQQWQPILAQPTWEEILEVLRNDLQRQYKIDIETNSTVDVAATEDKQDVAELMNALAQFLNGITPLVESGAMPFEAAQALLVAIVRRFRFGQEVEEQLKQLKPPQAQGQQPDPKVQAQAQQAQIELQMAQAQAAAKQQEQQQKAASDAAKMQMEQQQQAMDMEFARQQHAQRMQELQMQGQIAAEKYTQQLNLARQKAAKPSGV